MRRVVGALLLIAANTAFAQNKPIEFLTAVPTAPAFTFLGATPNKIERPGTLRDLGVALQNGIDEEGRAKNGFALDASIWNLIPGYDIPLDAYRRNPVKYAMANLQLSLATLKASGTKSDLQYAAGLKTVVYDKSDPMRDTSVTKLLAAGLMSCIPDQPGTGQNVACVDSVTQDVVGKFTKKHWNATQLAIAGAAGHKLGWSAWAVGASGLGTAIQLITQFTYTNKPAIDTVPAFTAMDFGVRAIGGSATWNVFVEYGKQWRDGLSQKTAGGWSGGVEFRVIENTWISTGVGTRYSVLNEPDRTIVVANIKWGVTSKSRIAPMIAKE